MTIVNLCGVKVKNGGSNVLVLDQIDELDLSMFVKIDEKNELLQQVDYF